MAQDAEEIEARWWERRRKADWSWRRLADRQIGRNGRTTHGGVHGDMDLQAYWRRDPATGEVRDDAAMARAGELVLAPGGAWWHLAHVPPLWPDGTEAKAGWDAALREKLAGLISARLAAARMTATNPWCDAAGPDGRAQLSGAVLLDAPEPAEGEAGPLHLVCYGAALPAWDAGRLTFGPGFGCRDAHFGDSASFASATFSGHASFADSVFAGDAWFGNASFAGDVGFERVAVLGEAGFRRATFTGGARFKGARFSKPTSLYNATFGADADFHASCFSGSAGFQLATFARRADFRSSAFGGDAAFDSATFTRGAHFGAAEFAAQASFTGARFLTTPNDADAPAVADFTGCRFNDLTHFTRAELHSAAIFQATVFERLVRFDGIKFPASPDLWQAIFSQTQFKDVAAFRGVGCRCFAAFDGAVFGAGLLWDDVGEVLTKRRFREELAQALRAIPPPEPPSPKMWSVQVGAILQVPREYGREAALKSLERGCRVLKQAMESSSDKTREQLYHAFELTARRHQRDTPAWERFFSHAYALTGDYGRSIGRPLLWLFVSIPVFACLYWLLLRSAGAEAGGRLINQSLTLSLGRVFPFGLWQVTGDAFQKSVLGNGSTGWSLAIRGLATLQSLLAIIFAFLAGLALRRRFQIS